MHKKKKEHKKRGIGWTILRIFLGAAGILVLVLVVYIGYLFASYHRIEDNLELEVEKPAEGNVDETLKTGTEYSALTYNIGFGAYTPDFSFFMDGGKSSWAKSKESVLETVSGAGKLAASYDPDFALIQEVDLNSTRSYHVNEYELLKESFPEYDSVFAQNYDSAFLFYPFTQPHGRSRSGLGLFSRYPVTSACGEASRSPLLLPNFSTWTAATASPGSRWKTAKNW